MNDIICKCGHSITHHQSLGCLYADDSNNWKRCTCQHTRDRVELDALRQRVEELEEAARYAVQELNIAFAHKELAFTRKRISDTDPYHPASIALTKLAVLLVQP